MQEMVVIEIKRRINTEPIEKIIFLLFLNIFLLSLVFEEIILKNNVEILEYSVFNILRYLIKSPENLHYPLIK